MTHAQSTKSIAGATALTLAAAALLASGATVAVASAAAPAAKGTSAKSAKAKPMAKAKVKANANAKARAKARNRRAKHLDTGAAQRALDALPPYTGPTGLVLHTKSVTVSFKITDDPHEQRGFTRTVEQWTELGGGKRLHEKATYRDADTGASGDGTEGWGSPWFSAIRTTDGPAALATFCQRQEFRTSADAAVREFRGDLASLPAGPVINGAPTKVATRVVFPARPDLSPRHQYFYDAATGVPVRSTQLTDGKLHFQTDYSLWEEQPAGGSAANLAGTLPSDAQLNNNDGTPCFG